MDEHPVLNPGSVGCPGYSWDFPAPPVVQAGIPDAACALVDRVRGRCITRLLHVPFDATAMVALAARQDSEGWARVVATGWME